MKTQRQISVVRGLTLAAAFVVSSQALAATYYWKGGTAEFGDFWMLSNWSTEGVDGADATQLPGEGDELYGIQDRSIDLGERDVVVSTLDSTASWDRHTTNLKNGSLKFVGHVWTHSLTLKLTDGAKVWYDCEYRSSQGHGAADELFVADGCEWKMTGTFNNYKLEAHIDAGGKAILDPTYFGIFWGSAQNSYFDVSGEMDLPNGINWQSGSFTGADNYFDFRLQNGGLIKLGGNFVRNEALTGRLMLSMAGGTLEATGDAAFSGVEATVSAQTDFKVDNGVTLDLGGVVFGTGVPVSKSGEGMAVFSTTMPSGLYLWGGDITIAAPNQTFEGSVSSTSPCGVKIAAKGFTFAAEVYSTVNFSIDSSVFAVGDVILTSNTPEVLAKAAADLTAVGVSTKIEDNQLKLAPSEIVFNSTTITDLNDPEGWKSKSVPGEGVAVTIAGEGVNAIVTAAIPAFASITVSDGATLKLDLEDVAIPAVKLENGGRLVLSKTAAIAGFDAALSENGDLGVLTVDAGATLKVPGNTKFKNVNLTLNGAVAGTTDGKLIFGYAAVDEIAKFAMTAEGATITALNSSGNENGSRIEFVCPEVGGAVEVTEPILLKTTTITYNSKDGMAFGLNNPTDKAFTIIADGKDLEVGAETVIAGAANLVLKNSRLFRRRHSEGDSGDSNYNIVVKQKGKITVDDGGSIYAGVTRVNGNVVDGAIRLQPDEAGFVGIEFLDGGTAHWYKANGYDMGAISFNDSTFEFTKAFWWGWGNRSHLFNRMTAVNLEEGKKLTFKCVKEAIYSSNSDTYTYFIMEAPFTGAGDLFFTSERSSQTMQPTFVCGNNTCTGTLSVDPEKNIMVHFANGANWAGTVVLNGKVDFSPADEDHSGQNGSPTELTFGAVKLEKDFTIRLWGADGLKNDKINITGAGWTSTEGAKLVFAIQDGYDPQQSDKWLLGTAPATATLPVVTEKWTFATEPVEGADGLVNVYLTPSATEYNFISNKDGSTNLNDPTAWSSGAVPVGKEVSIVGVGVVAEINEAQGLPSFASITVKGGATLRINADMTDTELPTLAVDAFSRIEIEDGAVVRLPMSLTTNVKEIEGDVELSKILVKQGGTLLLQAGMVLKNVDLEVYGTVKSEGAGILKFGYANAGETSYFALKADGAVFDIPGRDDGGITEIHWLSPAVGGCVKAVGAISFKDTTFPFYNGWTDYYRQYFCANNPETEEVVFTYDNTILEASYETFISGSSRMFFTNGGYMTRSTSFAGHGGDLNINGNAVVTFEGENSGVSFNVSTPQGLRLDSSTGNVRNAIVLKDGAYINVRRVFAANGAGIAVTGTGGNLMVDKPNGVDFSLYGGATITVDKDATAYIKATKFGGTGTDADREVEFLGQFAGEGKVEVVNGVPDKAFTVCLANGSPLFEGTIGIAAASEGTTLRFAAGMNWAGTVVWTENVSVSNLTSGAVSTTFENIELASGEFPIRVFRNGDKLASDTVNLTGAVIRGAGDDGVIRLVGEELKPNEKLVIGTAPAGAWAKAVIKTAAGHQVKIVESVPDEHGLVTATASVATGLIISVK